MKKVIDEKESNIVNLSEVDYNKYYGASRPHDGLKFLIHEGNNGNYRVLTLNEILFGDFSHFDSFYEAIGSAYKNYDLYEFDTQDECLAWLCQKD